MIEGTDPITGRPFVLQNFASKCFPIKIEALRSDTREVVWKAELEKPKGDELGKLYIPPLAKQHGVKVIIRVKFTDEPYWMECA